jgi:molybdenum cofactor cytidylyltransferase
VSPSAPNTSPPVVALLLAAGRGVRFGSTLPKLLADLDGRPLVRRAAESALASRASRVVVVTGHAREEIEAALAGLPLSLAHNAAYATGLAASLRAGLAAAADACGVVVLLADMPGVSSATVDALIAAFETAPDAPAVVPTHEGRRGNPVLLARRLFPRLAALQGDEGARKLLDGLDGVVEVAVEDDRILADVDTPADLARLRVALRRS